jgi:hypothetical protein
MVLAAKVFAVIERVDLDEIASKLKDFKTSEEVEQGEERFELVSEITDLRYTANNLFGIFSFDTLITLRQRERFKNVIRTYEAPFMFSKYKDSILLTVFEKKNRANNIANILSKLLFITTGKIVEARIKQDVMKRFHEENYEDTKVIYFDNVDLPNVNKLSLYGSSLADTTLYTDYTTHGAIWYTVIKSKKYGFVVGLTRNCVVTMFSKIELEEFMNYIINDVFPLITLPKVEKREEEELR